MQWAFLYDDDTGLLYAFTRGHYGRTLEFLQEAETAIFNELCKVDELDKLNDGLNVEHFHMRSCGVNAWQPCEHDADGAFPVTGMRWD